jgi:PKD repeat protein
VDDSATSATFTGGAQGGKAPYSFDWNFGDGSPHSPAQSPGHTFPIDTDLTTGKHEYSVGLTVTDANMASNTASISVTVLCAGAHTVHADIGSGTTNNIRVCGHWNPSMWPSGKTIANVRYLPPTGQTWQFSGAFNVYENHDPPGCPTQTTTLIECTGTKTGVDNPTNHFGGIFGTSPPAANGQVIRVQAVAGDGTILETQDVTVG